LYPQPIFLFINLFLKSSFAFVPSFINYPPAVIPCLTDAAVTSGCNADSITFQQNNACLCSNGGGYLTLAAQCIQANAPNDLQDVYTTSVGNCDNSNTPDDYLLGTVSCRCTRGHFIVRYFDFDISRLDNDSGDSSAGSYRHIVAKSFYHN
jgi:hypothetical protein